MPEDTVVDARGQRCPLPVLRAEKALDILPPGARLVVLADDPVARIDIPVMARKHGLGCEIAEDGAGWRFILLAGS